MFSFNSSISNSLVFINFIIYNSYNVTASPPAASIAALADAVNL